LEAPAEEKYDWSSDDDNIMDTECIDREAWWSKHIGFLGFHPYKEIVFLSQSSEIGLAYHLNSSRVQVLGSSSPANDGAIVEDQDYESSLPYTPCWIDECPGRFRSWPQTVY
jgi:hypothetical protein